MRNLTQGSRPLDGVSNAGSPKCEPGVLDYRRKTTEGLSLKFCEVAEVMSSLPG
jgi:hypothetical protein